MAKETFACSIVPPKSCKKHPTPLDNENSQQKTLQMDVSQGSVLGPFLFLIIINDLPENVTIKSVVYVDDTTLFRANRYIETLSDTMQSAQLCALNWYSTNGLFCNNDKTQQLFLS